MYNFYKPSGIEYNKRVTSNITAHILLSVYLHVKEMQGFILCIIYVGKYKSFVNFLTFIYSCRDHGPKLMISHCKYIVIKLLLLLI